MRVLLLATTAALFAVTFAHAVPPADRETTMHGGAATYAWEGPVEAGSPPAPPFLTATGEPCTKGESGQYCDQTLINVDVPSPTGVKLQLDIAPATKGDFDLYVYESDASAGPGMNVGFSFEEGDAPETVVVDGAQGYYLVKVVYFDVSDAKYSGTATLTGAPAPSGTPTATATATPTATATATPTPTATPTAAPTSAPPAAPTAAPTAVPTVLPDLVVRMSLRKTRTRTARRRGLDVRLTCSESCDAVLRARVDARTARRLRVGRRATTIGKAALTVSPEVTRSYRLPFSARARKRLRRGMRITVVAVVTDANGRRGRQVFARLKLR